MSAFADELDARIQSELGKYEHLVWYGRPEERAFARSARPIFWFGIPWTAFSVFWVVSASAMLYSGEGIQNAKGPELVFMVFPLFGIPFILVGIGLLTSPYWARRRARYSCYAVTNLRVILWTSGWLGGVEVRSYKPEQLGRIVRREYRDGTGDLVFEQITEQYTDSEGQRGTRTIERGIIGIEDVREIERLIRATFVPDNG